MSSSKRLYWNVGFISFKSISILFVNKIFAVFFGPTGITLLAHFQNLFSMLIQLPNDGINRGFSSLITQKHLDQKQRKQIVGSTLFYNILLFALTSLIIYFFRDFFLQYFTVQLSKQDFYFWLIFSSLVFMIHLFLLALILSLQKAIIYAITNIICSILLISLVYWGAENFYMGQALLILGAGQAAGIIISLIMATRYHLIMIPRLRFSNKINKYLWQFMVMSLSVLVFSKLTDFLVRYYAIETFGLQTTGFWQAVVKLSDSYMHLFLTTVGVIYYPQVSALIFDTDKLRNYLNDVLHLVIPVTLAGLGLIYFFRETIIILLFSPEFKDAKYLFKFHLAGDFFSIICYLLTYIVSAQARTITFILLQLGSALFYLGLVWFFTQYYGLEGIPIAHASRFLVVFLILLLLNRRLLF
ncbi:MAG: hypothetical protein ACNS62_21080 [Candidatus Cyclobacteriaceae bacterium M3_2C_046]